MGFRWFLSESDLVTDTGIKVKSTQLIKIIYVDYIVNLVDPTKNPENKSQLQLGIVNNQQM